LLAKREQKPWHYFAKAPRFFFTTRNGATTFDREGVELPDQGTARVEAVR
jgi:hypothetical protein